MGIGDNMTVKNFLKRFIFSNGITEQLYKSIVLLKNRGGGTDNTLTHRGIGRIHRDIIGKNNDIEIGTGTMLHKIHVRIRGNNNKLIIGDQCTVGERCSFWLEGNGITITVGNKCSFTRDIQLCAQEDGSKISLGEDCMLSNTIIIRTSDSHPIYSQTTSERINPAGNVSIGNHVWIAPNSKIFKGVTVGDGSIIGSDSLVTKNVSSHSLAVGHPAKIIKTDIQWTREKLY